MRKAPFAAAIVALTLLLAPVSAATAMPVHAATGAQEFYDGVARMTAKKDATSVRAAIIMTAAASPRLSSIQGLADLAQPGNAGCVRKALLTAISESNMAVKRGNQINDSIKIALKVAKVAPSPARSMIVMIKEYQGAVKALTRGAVANAQRDASKNFEYNTLMCKFY